MTGVDPLAQFGLDAIDLRWTLRDVAARRTWLINKEHLPKLIADNRYAADVAVELSRSECAVRMRARTVF